MYRAQWIALVGLLTSVLHCGAKQTPEERLSESLTTLSGTIDENVHDKPRAAELKRVTEELRDEMKRTLASEETNARALAGAYRDYATPPERLQQLLAAREADRAAHRTQILALRAQMVKLTNQEEWDALSHARMQSFEALFEAINSRRERDKGTGDGS
jgi:hypothetical protein